MVTKRESRKRVVSKVVSRCPMFHGVLPGCQRDQTRRKSRKQCRNLSKREKTRRTIFRPTLNQFVDGYSPPGEPVVLGPFPFPNSFSPCERSANFRQIGLGLPSI